MVATEIRRQNLTARSDDFPYLTATCQARSSRKVVELTLDPYLTAICWGADATTSEESFVSVAHGSLVLCRVADWGPRAAEQTSDVDGHRLHCGIQRNDAEAT